MRDIDDLYPRISIRLLHSYEGSGLLQATEYWQFSSGPHLKPHESHVANHNKKGGQVKESPKKLNKKG